MLKEAIEKIAQMTSPAAIEINGRTYSTGAFNEIKPSDPARPSPLALSTLTGLADYLRHDVETVPIDARNVFIHVKTPQIVNLISAFDDESSCRRTTYVQAICEDNVSGRSPTGSTEDIIIDLRSNFAPTEDRDRLLASLGNMVHESSVEYADDGVTPSVTVRQGLSMKGREAIPPIVILAPYHSFREIDQVQVPYAVRIRGGGKDNPITIRLIDASGGSWKNQAILRVKEWLDENIDGDIPVLA